MLHNIRLQTLKIPQEICQSILGKLEKNLWRVGLIICPITCLNLLHTYNQTQAGQMTWWRQKDFKSKVPKILFKRYSRKTKAPSWARLKIRPIEVGVQTVQGMLWSDPGTSWTVEKSGRLSRRVKILGHLNLGRFCLNKIKSKVFMLKIFWSLRV